MLRDLASGRAFCKPMKATQALLHNNTRERANRVLHLRIYRRDLFGSRVCAQDEATLLELLKDFFKSAAVPPRRRKIARLPFPACGSLLRGRIFRYVLAAVKVGHFLA